MITGTISADDYLQAQRLHRQAALPWCYAGGAVILVVGFVLVLFGELGFGLIALCSGVGALVGELLVACVFLPRKARQLHSQQKALSSPINYSWDREYFEARGVYGSSKRPWKDYWKINENDHLFLLYHADNLFSMVPKAWFTSESQVSEFRELAGGSHHSELKAAR